MEHIRAFVHDFDPPTSSPVSPPNIARASSSVNLSASTRGPPVERPPIHRRSTSLTSENAAAFAEGAFSSLRKGIRSGASHVTRAGRGSIDQALDVNFFADSKSKRPCSVTQCYKYLQIWLAVISVRLQSCSITELIAHRYPFATEAIFP